MDMEEEMRLVLMERQRRRQIRKARLERHEQIARTVDSVLITAGVVFFVVMAIMAVTKAYA